MVLNKLNESLIFYTKIISIFSFILGASYLLGFWHTIGINIFPFLSLLDLVKFSAFPFLIIIVPWMLINWYVAEFHMRSHIERCSNWLKLHLKKSNRLIRVLIIGGIIIYFGAAVITGIIFKLMTVIVGVPVASIIIFVTFEKIKNIEDESYKKKYLIVEKLLIWLSLLPLSGYDFGHFQALNILQGRCSYTLLDFEDKTILYKYVGLVNDHYFFLSKTNQLLHIRNNVQNLSLYNSDLENNSKYRVKPKP